MKDFVGGVLKSKVDFGVIPGSDKPSLLKPGAEKLASFFGLRPVFPIVETIKDWTGVDHGGEPFFNFHYKCQLYRNGELVGEGIGSCNSWESKYRYRSSNRVCPTCGKETIIKGKEEFGGGWLCYAKKGGCGAKFKDSDKSIIDQVTGKTKNVDIFDQVNTLDKMAQKRALIAAVLIATNASDYFTQDIEDFIDVEYHEVEPIPVAQPELAPEVPLDDVAEMPLELAESEKTSKGQLYGTLSTSTLSFMYKAISGKPQTDELQRKLTAIQTILKHRGG